ncbi:MAG: hypothetical protein LBV12_06220 [Puniceicoccales bacterium]|nr:hypothetical protein [Puniceicoccales bacterium]
MTISLPHPRVLLTLLVCLIGIHSTVLGTPPPPGQNLTLKAPIKTWDEGIPLGNGLTGGLLFGSDNLLIIGLDRGDLWDERPYSGVGANWWKKYPWQDDRSLPIGDNAYRGASPTKLPGGRIHITLADDQKLTEFGLSYATAEGYVKTTGGHEVRSFFSATAPIAFLKISGPAPKSIDVLSPLDVVKYERGNNAAGHSPGSVDLLGYPDATQGKNETARWYLQKATDGLSYCVYIDTRRSGNETVAAIAITSTEDGSDPVAIARQRCTNALAQGYNAAFQPHARWWKNFWDQSSVTIPQSDIQQQYTFVRYLYGTGSRLGAPPMPLQGVWTANDGKLPPWKGDYHTDLNTQMTYIAYFGSGDFESGNSFLEYLWNLRPFFREFAKDFYQTNGLSVPGVMTLAGQPIGGWPQYSLSPTNTAWNAHQFYLHWRYTQDKKFLQERAYPWCSEAGQCLAELLKPDDTGTLKLLRSTSPEIHDNSARSWMKPNTNYDNMCIKMLFLSLQEMADACNKPDDAKKWATLAEKLGPWHVAPDGELMLSSEEKLTYSHRHLSNLMGLFPFNLITSEGGQAQQQQIKASLNAWDKLGTRAWVGYSFSWMSCLRARVGDAEGALRNLDIYTKAFVLRNGFHVNGDQTRSGFSGFTYRPFTLEGNFLAMQAVHEMYLQSWSATPGQRDTEVIRVFPAMPWRWHEASFSDLRTEGAHRVSARWENNATVWFKLVAGKNGIVRIRDNFDGRVPKWSRNGVVKKGENFEVSLNAGEILEATLDKPKTIPAEPENAAEPVVIQSRIGLNATKLPLRLGADGHGGNKFRGDIAQAYVFDRVLSPQEIAALAIYDRAIVPTEESGQGGELPPAAKNAAMAFDINRDVKTVGGVTRVPATGRIKGEVFHFDGTGYLEIPSSPRLNGTSGLTLAAWIRPDSVDSDMRIFDKAIPGQSVGYLLDTHPKNSLRLLTQLPSYSAKLQVGEWVHVAGTVNPSTKEEVLYLNGKEVSRRTAE